MTTRRRLVLAIALFAAFLGSFVGYARHVDAQTQYMYLAHWEWREVYDGKDLVGAYWQCPGGDCLGVFDLRSIPQMAQAGGTPEGYGLFVYDHPISCLGCYTLGTSWDKVLTATDRTTLSIGLGLTSAITETRLSNIIAVDFLINNADPTGQTKWKPIRGSKRHPPTLYIGGRKVWEGSLADVIDNTIAVYRVDYQRMKLAGVPLERLQKITGAKMLDLWARMGDDLLLPLLGRFADDGWSSPETSISDDFSGTLAAWTQLSGTWSIFSGELTMTAEVNSNPRTIRHDTTLSSDDHYAQIDVVASQQSTNPTFYGTSIRHTSGATETCYAGGYTRPATAGDPYQQIYKFVTGTPTSLGTDHTFTESLPHTMYFEANDTTLTVKRDGADDYQISDSSISGQNDTGVAGNRRTSGGGYALDDFAAADLAAPAARRIIIIH